jgi:aspartate aminotransferase-like enzyme
MYKKLFIPGPTHVRDEILQAQTAPMIGHRAKEYSDLQAEVTPKLQTLLYTKQRVYLFASSSSGVMEGSVRQAWQTRLCPRPTMTPSLWSTTRRRRAS